MRRRREFPSKPRGFSRRTADTLPTLERFLIVCEGEKTEPGYFRAFRVPKDVVDVRGLGDHTLNLMRCAIKLTGSGEYDQVWCVLDRDSFPAERFNAALELAGQHGIRVAYSNEAFELWYLLHFQYCDAGIPRTEYGDRLTQRMGRPYRKNCDTMYDELLERQPEAIRNAGRLLAQYRPARPARDNSSTTVHVLVSELNRFLR